MVVKGKNDDDEGREAPLERCCYSLHPKGAKTGRKAGRLVVGVV